MAAQYLCTTLKFPKNPSGKNYNAEESMKAYEYLYSKGSGYKSILEDILWRPFAEQFSFKTADKGTYIPAKNEDGFIIPKPFPDSELFKVLQEFSYHPTVYLPGEYEELNLNWSSGTYHDSYLFLLLMMFGDNATDFIISQLIEYARFAFLPSEPIHHERKKRLDRKPENIKRNKQSKSDIPSETADVSHAEEIDESKRDEITQKDKKAPKTFTELMNSEPVSKDEAIKSIVTKASSHKLTKVNDNITLDIV